MNALNAKSKAVNVNYVRLRHGFGVTGGGYRNEIAFCLFIISFFISAPADAVSSAGYFLPVAQLPSTTSEALGSWLIQFMAVMVIVIAILQIISFFKRKPTIDAEFATKAELGDVESDLKESIVKVENKMDDLRKEVALKYGDIQTSGEKRAGKIHNRINVVLVACAKICGKLGIEINTQEEAL